MKSFTMFHTLVFLVLFVSCRSSSADTAGEALALVDKIVAKTNVAIGVARQQSQTTKDPNVLQALRNCGGYYNAIIVGDVPMAREALTKGNPKFAEQGADDAANEVQWCEAGFPRGSSPVTQLNEEIGQLARSVAALAKQLE